jgi:hypothetical protein
MLLWIFSVPLKDTCLMKLVSSTMESQAELSRIQGIVASLGGRNDESVCQETLVIIDTLEAVQVTRKRSDRNRMTDALVAQTKEILQKAEDSLNGILRNIEFHVRHEREPGGNPEKATVDDFETKAAPAEQDIANMIAEAVKRTPDTTAVITCSDRSEHAIRGKKHASSRMASSSHGGTGCVSSSPICRSQQ